MELKAHLQDLDVWRDALTKWKIDVSLQQEEMHDLRKAREEDKDELENMQNIWKKDRIENRSTHDNLITLENYIERYFPIVTARLLHKIFVPLAETPGYEERLINNIEEIIEEHQTAILEDVG